MSRSTRLAPGAAGLAAAMLAVAAAGAWAAAVGDGASEGERPLPADRPTAGAPPAPLAAGAGIENVPYDGRFTLARIRFDVGLGRGFGWGRGSSGAPWAHDYPRSERNLMLIAREVSHIRPSMDGGNVFDLGDPELFRFPVAYMVEPGYWRPEDEEVRALREYLLKGGFLIVDDFRGNDWVNFEAQMRRVLPDHSLVELDVENPVFQSFLPMEALDFPAPYDRGEEPRYLGIYEGDDPDRRLMVVVNHNQDIGDYWEYADIGRYAVDPSNDAFKLGLNYLIYAMTR